MRVKLRTRDNEWVYRWVYKDKVTAWAAHNFTGARVSYKIGDHPMNGKRGYQRNRISSIYIPPLLKVRIFKGTAFTGEEGEWRRTGEGMAYVGDWWNDKVSSMRVIKDMYA